MSQTASLPSSPCVEVCQLDDEGLCIGCLRTMDEITCWPEMDSESQWRLLDELDRRRVRSVT